MLSNLTTSSFMFLIIIFLLLCLINELLNKKKLVKKIEDISSLSTSTKIKNVFIQNREIFNIIEKINFSSFYFFSLKKGIYNILEFIEILPHPSPFHSEEIDKYFFLAIKEDITIYDNREDIVRITGDCIADKMIIFKIDIDNDIFLLINCKISLNISFDQYINNIFNEISQYYISKRVEINKKILVNNREYEFIDTLSLLKNRKALSIFDKYFDYCFLIIIDIDNFKMVNDNYGHQKGDQLIRYIGSLFIEYFNEGSEIFRYGGDEFVVLTHFSKMKIDRTILNINRLLKSKYEYISLSFGISKIKIEENIDIAIKKADIKLYNMKKMVKS